MRTSLRVVLLAVAILSVGGSVPPARACMECEPAYVLINQYGSSCVITTIDYDCEVCTVVPDPCESGGGHHVWHRY